MSHIYAPDTSKEWVADEEGMSYVPCKLCGLPPGGDHRELEDPVMPKETLLERLDRDGRLWRTAYEAGWNAAKSGHPLGDSDLGPAFEDAPKTTGPDGPAMMGLRDDVIRVLVDELTFGKHGFETGKSMGEYLYDRLEAEGFAVVRLTEPDDLGTFPAAWGAYMVADGMVGGYTIAEARAEAAALLAAAKRAEESR